MTRRNAVRRKTAKYLVAAERLYRTHLAYDGAVPIVNLESLVESTMTVGLRLLEASKILAILELAKSA